MAKNRESFYVMVKQEGAAGATRGKLSSAACLALGAEDGDVIEIEVRGQDIVGGGVLSAKDAKEYLKEHSRGSSRSAKKTPAKKGRKTVSSSEDEPRPKKKGKKSKVKAKAGKRRTEVEYDEPRPKKKLKGKKGKFSLKNK